MDTPEAVLDRFSGLGIPTSFQKTMYSTREGSDQIGHLANFYQKLCRGEPLHVINEIMTFVSHIQNHNMGNVINHVDRSTTAQFSKK